MPKGDEKDGQEEIDVIQRKEPTAEERAARGDFVEEEEIEEYEEESIDEEKKEEIDSETLKSIAEEGEAEEEKEKKGWVPSSRLRETSQKRQEAEDRVRQLEQELEEEKRKKVEPLREAKADKEEIRELLKRKNDALVDGDTETAANLDLEIIEKSAVLSSEAIKKMKDDVRAEMKAESEAESQATLQGRLTSIAEDAYKTYSFLNPDADIVNNKAIKEVKAKRDEYYSGGMPIAEALKKAIEDVGPKYLEGKEVGKEREKETKLRNADTAGKQPPNLNSSGSQRTGEEKDPSKMSRSEYNKWWDSLSESEKKKYQGDMT